MKIALAAAAVALFSGSMMAIGGTFQTKRAGDAHQVTGKAAPVVLELFTSEGCSSCPSADDVLAKLVREQSVPGARIIALGQHVDYWNRLGWTDPFSAHQFSERQNEYATSFRSNQVYTPQAVVDGATEFVGSDEDRARTAIAEAARQPKANVELNAQPDGSNTTVQVRVSDLPKGAGEADVYVALTEDNLSTQVRSGENSGRHLSHTAVVRQLKRIGEVSASAPFNGGTHLALGNLPKNHLHVVVFVQAPRNRHIYGAAIADL